LSVTLFMGYNELLTITRHTARFAPNWQRSLINQLVVTTREVQMPRGLLTMDEMATLCKRASWQCAEDTWEDSEGRWGYVCEGRTFYRAAIGRVKLEIGLAVSHTYDEGYKPRTIPIYHLTLYATIGEKVIGHESF